ASNKRSDQQQIADIGAGNEQHECNDRHHHLKRGKQFAGMVEWRLPQSPQLDAASAVGGGVIILQSCRERRNLLLSLSASDAGFHDNVRLNPTRAPVLKPVSSALEGL